MITTTFVTSQLAVGTHVINAVYSGDASFAGSTSPTLSRVVKPVQAIQTIAFEPISDKRYGDPLLRLNAEYAKQFGVETPGWPSRPT